MIPGYLKIPDLIFLIFQDKKIEKLFKRAKKKYFTFSCTLERQAFCLACPLNLSPRQNLRCPSRHFTLSKSFHVHRNFHQLLSHGNCTGARTWCTSSNFETFWDSCHWDQRFQLRVIDRWCRPGATDRGTLSPTSDHLVLTCTWRSTITLCLTISHFSLNLAHKRIRCSASQQSWLEVHIGEGNAAEVEVAEKFYLLPPPFAFPPAFLTQPG